MQSRLQDLAASHIPTANLATITAAAKNDFVFFFTQGLIDLVASCHGLAADEGDKFNFLEVGCGSGAICLSILSEYPKVS